MSLMSPYGRARRFQADSRGRCLTFPTQELFRKVILRLYPAGYKGMTFLDGWDVMGGEFHHTSRVVPENVPRLLENLEVRVSRPLGFMSEIRSITG
jgi:hypothetical protein